ncbi:MAG TPA: sterol desaturase family protein [Stellaceae bacterium]|nr:sterol desaturase family protein [Stellaceae bacterium]
MVDAVMQLIGQVQGTVFEASIQPLLYHFGLMDWAETVFDGLEVPLLGVLAIVLAYALFRPLEWWCPVERWADRRAVWTDIAYTIIHKLGLVPAILFLLLSPIGAAIDGYLRFQGYIPPSIEQVLPPLAGWPFATFLVYVVILDFGEYWRHRLQHRLPWWWALHSLHHDQRQMTLWSDDRNHVLDDVLAATWSGTVAMLIGVTPGEFPLVMILFRLVESLSHTNTRIGFGRVGGALLVGPQYHRLHHSIEHAEPPFGRTQGCNFGVILPVWDLLFGTWRHAASFPPTGVAALDGRAVRCGYLAHQVDGLRRLGAALAGMVSRRHPGFPAAFPAE